MTKSKKRVSCIWRYFTYNISKAFEQFARIEKDYYIRWSINRLKSIENKLEDLVRDEKNQRIFFVIMLMLFTVITGAILIELISNPSIFDIILLIIPVIIALGIRRQKKIIDIVVKEKNEAMLLASKIKNALMDEYKKEVSQ